MSERSAKRKLFDFESSDMKGQILEIIKKRDHVTYAELSEYIDGFRYEPGEDGRIRVLEHPKFRNFIFWVNVSEEGSAAMNELLEDGKIHWVSTTPLTYMIDGSMLHMPLVKGERAYKKPHWLPVCFRLGPCQNKAKREKRKAKIEATA